MVTVKNPLLGPLGKSRKNKINSGRSRDLQFSIIPLRLGGGEWTGGRRMREHGGYSGGESRGPDEICLFGRERAWETDRLCFCARGLKWSYHFTRLKGSFLPKGLLIFSVHFISKKIDFYMLLSAAMWFLPLEMPFAFSRLLTISKPNVCDGNLCVALQPSEDPCFKTNKTLAQHPVPNHIYLSKTFTRFSLSVLNFSKFQPNQNFMLLRCCSSWVFFWKR